MLYSLRWAVWLGLYSSVIRADDQGTLKEKHPELCPDYKRYSMFPQYVQ